MLVALFVTAPAQALETHGVKVSNHATGFPTRADRGVGPIGLAFDERNRLFVASSADGFIYRFSGPGAAGAGTRLGSVPVGGFPNGLAIDRSGRLYVARRDGNDILEINRETGAVVRTVASGLPCPIGLAFDPVSGDMYATDGCADVVRRITGLNTANPTVQIYATGLPSLDGVAVAPDGTVFVDSEQNITRIEGPRSPNPGAKSKVVRVTGADGVAIGADGAGKPRFLVVSRTNGRITRVDLRGSNTESRDLVTGASRGSLATVDANGCFFASLADRVVKITDRNGACAGLIGGLEPTTPGQSGGGDGVLPPTPRRGCLDRRKFKWRLHHAPGVRVTSVDIYVNGKRRVKKRGHSINRVALRRLPQGRFRVRIVAKHSDGTQIRTSRMYRGCKKGKPKGRRTEGRRGGRRGGR